MKIILSLAAALCLLTSAIAQDKSDTAGVPAVKDKPDTAGVPAVKDTMARPQNDTIRVGGMIIIRSGKDRNNSDYSVRRNRFRTRNRNVTTNWWIVDLGINGVNDRTNYPAAISAGYLPAGANADWFDQLNLKSTNVNIWLFMQRLNLVKHVVNLKYGLGVELNNYKYTENIRFQETSTPLVIMENVDYRKNKLAADYITLPVMLNFNFNRHHRNHGFGISAGVSAGYLYSSRQKTIGGGMGKFKNRDDFDMRDFKIAYITELSLGPVRLYGSYATKSMFENALDQRPYSFGIRFSNWESW